MAVADHLPPPPKAGGWVARAGMSVRTPTVQVYGLARHTAVAASVGAPSLGPSRGGTRVSLLGGGFRDAYTLRCAFGSSSAPVLARYVDESQLECATPLHAIGAKAVQLSMNGQQYASTGVAFTYQQAMSVSSVSPARVLAEGGTPVTVYGAGFSSVSESLGYLQCRIGGVARRARWASTGALVCNSTRGRTSSQSP